MIKCVGVFLLFAVSGQAVLPFLMGGYASNNKYSFIGGMRIVGQMLSYEAPLLTSPSRLSSLLRPSVKWRS